MALPAASSERNELEQTNSANCAVLCDGGGPRGPHFVQHDRHAAARKLPGGFGTGKPTANHMNRPQ